MGPVIEGVVFKTRVRNESLEAGDHHYYCHMGGHEARVSSNKEMVQSFCSAAVLIYALALLG